MCVVWLRVEELRSEGKGEQNLVKISMLSSGKYMPTVEICTLKVWECTLGELEYTWAV